jgi:uncharacterized RDD family membrane protein YckC
MTEGTGRRPNIDPAAVPAAADHAAVPVDSPTPAHPSFAAYPAAPPAPESSPPVYRGFQADPSPEHGLSRQIAAAAGLTSPGRRLVAMLLDVLLFVVTLGVGWLVWALIVFKDGRTPGKQLLHMRVVDVRTGIPLRWGMMFVREFLVRGLLISALSTVTLGVVGLVAALMILSPLHQTMWDRMCNTTVADG